MTHYDDHVTIGELIETGDTLKTRRDLIEVWPGYGVTCYPLGSLNGSIPAVAENLKAMVDEQAQMRRELSDPAYTVTVILDGKPVACTDKQALIDQLSALYQQHNRRSA